MLEDLRRRLEIPFTIHTPPSAQTDMAHSELVVYYVGHPSLQLTRIQQRVPVMLVLWELTHATLSVEKGYGGLTERSLIYANAYWGVFYTTCLIAKKSAPQRAL
jgi:hypothetical protein